MRIMIHGTPPWAQSGYGVQCKLMARALIELGHAVAISAYAGVHEERDWHGFPDEPDCFVPILGTGGKAYGNGVIAGNYRRWRADLLITLCDPWTLEPGQFAGLHVMPWMPVDTATLGLMDRQWLERVNAVAASVRPVAMSEHGRRCLGAAGWDAPVVPHAASDDMRPDPEAGRTWRESIGLPVSAHVITKVGVNCEDDRKAFEVTLVAFAELSRGRSAARLYLHTEPQAHKAPNLAMMALDLGLKGKVCFAREHERACDLYTAADMRAIYNGSDVIDMTSKGEGFGVCAIEALACGTPLVGCRNSATTEKIRPDWGWLIGGQRTWARHHNAWWIQPSARELERAYHQSLAAAKPMRTAAAREGQRWSPAAMREAWAKALAIPVPVADHAKAFTEVYRSGAWGQGSGPGSDPLNAGEYLEFIRRYVREHDVSSVLDLGCGDGRLAQASELYGVEIYTGLDVMTGHDIRTCDLPPADLVLIKDVFQHWGNADIQAMLARLDNYPRVLITNYAGPGDANSDIRAGMWRPIDLASPPFCWPVREVLRWDAGGEAKSTVELLRQAT